MPSSDYSASTGALKLKGAGGVTKKKKSKKSKSLASEKAEQSLERAKETSSHHKNGDGESSEGPEKESVSAIPVEGETSSSVKKTEAELRFEEKKRQRLEEKLKRDGAKTHKERVEDLNRYLSTLSEHHDMPRIGPG